MTVIANHILATVLSQLATAFPEHEVTLVLRDPEEPSHSRMCTTEENFMPAIECLSRRALEEFTPKEPHS